MGALVATGAASVVSSLHLVKMSLLVVLHELLGVLLGVLSMLGSLLVVLLRVSLLHHATEVDGGWGCEVVGRVGATGQEDGRRELLDSSLGPLLGGLLDELLLVGEDLVHGLLGGGHGDLAEVVLAVDTLFAGSLAGLLDSSDSGGAHHLLEGAHSTGLATPDRGSHGLILQDVGALFAVLLGSLHGEVSSTVIHEDVRELLLLLELSIPLSQGFLLCGGLGSTLTHLAVLLVELVATLASHELGVKLDDLRACSVKLGLSVGSRLLGRQQLLRSS